MKDYLSIGEVSKLKKVTIKALRYYEKIGILKPAFVQEETGYRYYTMEQMVVLDFILTCVELGIPLKHFSSYWGEHGVLDIDRILQEGTRVAQRQISRIQRTMEKLKNMSRHLEESEQLPACGIPYARFFPERCLLLKPMNVLHPTQKQYLTSLTELYFCMEENGYTSLYNQGLLYRKVDEQLRCFAFYEVEEYTDRNQLFVLPAGDWHCQGFDKTMVQNWQQTFAVSLDENKNRTYILLQERYQHQLSSEPYWSVQVL
ncbi:MAG: MerR family transcriptional regulator [Fusicatenibacter sp.]